MKLATIEKIDVLRAHPDADALEIVEVLGYQCVVPIGLHKEGDLIVYVQPDTCLPKDQEWAEEYIKYSPKRVKAVRLRGEWSEGVVAPLSKWNDPNVMFFGLWFTGEGMDYDAINKNAIGKEVSELIGVVKYDPPLPKNEAVVGRLPYQMGKTDEERFENMEKYIPYGEFVDLSLKIDGQSSTHGYKLDEDKYFITGRNYEVPTDEENRYSIHAEKVRDKLIAYCKKYKVSLAVRGESYGTGIQGSKHNVHSAKSRGFAIYSVFNIDKRGYEHKGSLHYFVNACAEMDLETVDMIEEDVVLTKELIEHYSKGIKKLPNGNAFEGIVVKHANGTFKIINKYYDAKK